MALNDPGTNSVGPRAISSRSFVVGFFIVAVSSVSLRHARGFWRTMLRGQPMKRANRSGSRAGKSPAKKRVVVAPPPPAEETNERDELRAGEEVDGTDEGLRAAEAQLGIPEWIDPDTAGPARGS